MHTGGGAAGALEGKKVPFLSEGGRKTIEEAMRTDTEESLFVVFMGPLTDIAQAYLTEPATARRLTCIWIGGGKYPDVLLLEQLFGYRWRAAPFITKDMMYGKGRQERRIKIYERGNTCYILEDFYTKLA